MKAMKSMVFALLVLLAGCKGNEEALKSLKEREWQLKSMKMDGRTLENPSELPVILFSDSTSVYGSAGCNRFFGKYTADAKGNLSVLPGGSTMMACPDMEFESKYLDALSQVKRFRIAGQQLTLSGEGGKLQLVYRRNAAE